jgi:hypothetical protein
VISANSFSPIAPSASAPVPLRRLKSPVRRFLPSPEAGDFATWETLFPPLARLPPPQHRGPRRPPRHGSPSPSYC